MSKCGNCKKLIHEYLNSGRSQQIKEKLNLHLSVCHSCKEYFDYMLTINNSLRKMKSTSVINVKDAVMERIREEQPQPVKYRKVYIGYAAAVACVAIVVGVFAVTGGFRTGLYKKAAGIPYSTYRDSNEQIIEKEPAFAPRACTMANEDTLGNASADEKDFDDMIICNYSTDKSYNDLMKEITDLSEQFVIFNIYNQADKNEISFISNTVDTEKISSKLNLKKDITVKAETDTADSVSEYTKVIILYKD
ncbi:MAG: hypothetical protein BWX78_01723 [Firmicutes bacterium ADurb.Bin099]|nr:MAG: hypothetical protein BWX78_01723 [Firmicutes bacterium ADurb.Bin099]